MVKFRHLCIVSCFFCLGTFSVLTAHPPLMYFFFGLEGSPSADVMSRRAGMLFLGLGTILWRLRDLTEGTARAGLAIGVSVLMAGFVILGIYEYARGSVGPGILLAVAVEVIVGTLFARHVRSTNAPPYIN